MSVIVILVGASLIVAIGFLAAYLWAVKSGQYDDKYTPSVRILFGDKNNSDGDAASESGREKDFESKK
jgi:cbb3-type cytochrome oxidase maturation protein